MFYSYKHIHTPTHPHINIVYKHATSNLFMNVQVDAVHVEVCLVSHPTSLQSNDLYTDLQFYTSPCMDFPSQDEEREKR